MRKKELKLITTFHTTADALMCEKVCKEKQIEGRVIPVPRQLSSGCGLAWCCEPGQKESFAVFLEENGVEFEDMAEIMF